MDFVKEIEAKTGRKLTSIDIGGGLSTTYKGYFQFAYQIFASRQKYFGLTSNFDILNFLIKPDDIAIFVISRVVFYNTYTKVPKISIKSFLFALLNFN